MHCQPTHFPNSGTVAYLYSYRLYDTKMPFLMNSQQLCKFWATSMLLHQRRFSDTAKYGTRCCSSGFTTFGIYVDEKSFARLVLQSAATADEKQPCAFSSLRSRRANWTGNLFTCTNIPSLKQLPPDISADTSVLSLCCSGLKNAFRNKMASWKRSMSFDYTQRYE